MSRTQLKKHRVSIRSVCTPYLYGDLGRGSIYSAMPITEDEERVPSRVDGAVNKPWVVSKQRGRLAVKSHRCSGLAAHRLKSLLPPPSPTSRCSPRQAEAFPLQPHRRIFFLFST